MKQLIVMVATVILGVAIAALVLGFRTEASDLATSAGESISSLVSTF